MMLLLLCCFFVWLALQPTLFFSEDLQGEILRVLGASVLALKFQFLGEVEGLGELRHRRMAPGLP